jgi:hypothetical protein
MTLPATTTPPTTADRALLAFANAAELAARDLYAVAAELPAFGTEEKTVLVGFHDHHLAASQALAGLVGKAATNVREDAVYNAFRGKVMGSDKSAIFDALREMENTLVSTHVSLVGTLEGTEGSALVASILTIQARHAAALALLGGRSLADALSNSAASLTPGASS